MTPDEKREYNRIFMREHRKKYPEHYKARGIAEREKRREYNRAYMAAYKAWKKNPEASRAACARYHEKNRDKRLAYMREYGKKHREKIAAKCTARNSKMRRAMPKWAGKAAIRAVYAEAKVRSITEGIPYHVDHIIPLCGKIVSGLHVETNLRVIAATDNLRKRNKFESRGR